MNIKNTSIVIMFAVFMFFFYKFIIYRIDLNNERSILIDGTKNAKHSLVITQDPKDKKSIILHRSDNQAKGIEFSYVC